MGSLHALHQVSLGAPSTICHKSGGIFGLLTPRQLTMTSATNLDGTRIWSALQVNDVASQPLVPRHSYVSIPTMVHGADKRIAEMSAGINCTGQRSHSGSAACCERKLAGSCQLPTRGAASAPRLRCRAAGGGSGGEEEPQLSEEELKQMEEDLLKEFMEGMGADDPESKKYESKVRPYSV